MVMMTGVKVSYGQQNLAQYAADVYKTLEGKWVFESVVSGNKLAQEVEIMKRPNSTYYSFKITQPQQALYDFGSNEVDLNSIIDLYHEGDGKKVSLIHTYLGDIRIMKNNKVDVRTSFRLAFLPQYDANGYFSKINLVTYIEEWKRATNKTVRLSFDICSMVRTVDGAFAIRPVKIESAQSSINYANYKVDKFFPAPLTIQQIKEAYKSLIASSQKGDLKVALKPKLININITPLNLPQAPSYTLDNIQFETLTVDSELGIYEDKTQEWCKDMAEYTGYLNLKVLRAKTGGLQANLGTIFDYDERRDALYLKLKEIVDCTSTFSKTFIVPQADFQTAILRFEGRLTDIDAPYFDAESGNTLSGKARPSNDVNLQLSSQFTDVLLKDLKVGYNFIDINRNGRSFRIHFTINPNKS